MKSNVAKYLDLSQTDHVALFDSIQEAWEVLPKIATYLSKICKGINLGKCIGTPIIEPDVFIDEGTVIEPGAYIQGPAWIGKNCQIRHGCYIRGNVIVGDDCVLGNSCEFKNSILFNGVQAPHFNYVGDSVLGFKSHLGAGVICSNVRLDHRNVKVQLAGQVIDSGLKKFGAIVGDFAEVGCNSVLNPGSLIGRKAMIMPCTAWIGALEEGKIGRTKRL